MRKDFGKVVIERPRKGSSARNAKVRWFGKFVPDDEEGGYGFEYEGVSRIPGSDHAEGFIRKKIYYKQLTDVLGPIKRFLRKNVGRVWNDVYSELSQVLNRGGWGVEHIRGSHVEVAVNTYRGVDGEVWYNGKRGPFVVNGNYETRFYVEPETGRLRAYKRSYQWTRTEPDFVDLNKVRAGANTWYVNVGGIWFLGTYVETVPGRDDAGSAWPNQKVGWRESILYFKPLKSCSKKEIRDLLKKRDADLAKKCKKMAG